VTCSLPCRRPSLRNCSTLSTIPHAPPTAGWLTRRVGDDPTVWRTLFELAGDFSGTLVELTYAARALTDGNL